LVLPFTNGASIIVPVVTSDVAGDDFPSIDETLSTSVTYKYASTSTATATATATATGLTTVSRPISLAHFLDDCCKIYFCDFRFMTLNSFMNLWQDMVILGTTSAYFHTGSD
jgi:hypothetical protein